jgi:hypothetical protein
MACSTPLIAVTIHAVACSTSLIAVTISLIAFLTKKIVLLIGHNNLQFNSLMMYN